MSKKINQKFTKKEIKTTLIILFLIILDLFTKTIFTNINLFTENIFFINYTKNFGSSFGIFANLNYYSFILIILATICIFAIILYRKIILKNILLTTSIIFFLSGVIGNTIDRILFGYVRDFIGIKYLFIFNLADFYITLAFIFYVLYELKINKVTTNNKNKSS